MQLGISATRPERASPHLGQGSDDAVKGVSGGLPAVSNVSVASVLHSNSPWPGRDGRLIELWEAGHTTVEIARTMVMTKSQICGRAHRLQGRGLIKPRGSPLGSGRAISSSKGPRPSRPKKMTAVDVEELLRLQLADRVARVALPTRQVLSVDEVVGILRLGDSDRVGHPKSSVGPASSPGVRQDNDLSRTLTVEPVGYPVIPPEGNDAAPPAVATGTPAVPARFARPTECCWPIGEPGTRTFRFCSATAVARTPYCEEHAKLAYVDWQPREDAA